MSTEQITRVKCEACGKTQDCSPEELKRPVMPTTEIPNPIHKEMDTYAPKGWLLVTASVMDKWAGWYGEANTLEGGRGGLEFHHACSRPCAEALLLKLAKIVAGG